MTSLGARKCWPCIELKSISFALDIISKTIIKQPLESAPAFLSIMVRSSYAKLHRLQRPMLQESERPRVFISKAKQIRKIRKVKKNGSL